MRTFIREGSTHIGYFETTVANPNPFEFEITRLFVPFEVDILTGSVFSNLVGFIELRCQVIVS